MSIFENYMRGLQSGQQQALQQLKMQQAAQMLPFEQQLKAMQIERERQGIEGDKFKTQLAKGSTLGSIGMEALKVWDENPELAKSIVAGANQRYSLGIDDVDAITKTDVESFVRQTPRANSAKFGRVITGKDSNGNLVFFQADESGKPNILQGVTPMDIQQQRIDIQREIAEGRIAAEEKKAATVAEEKRKEIGADIKELSNIVTQVESIIQNPEFDGSVGMIDQWTAKIGAQFDTEQGLLNRRAKRVLSTSVAGIAKTLGANPTDSDIVLLKETMPSMGDQPSVWQDWYVRDFIPTINKRLIKLGQPEIEPTPIVTEPKKQSRSEPKSAIQGRNNRSRFQASPMADRIKDFTPAEIEELKRKATPEQLRQLGL